VGHHAGAVRALAFAPNGARVGSGGDDGVAFTSTIAKYGEIHSEPPLRGHAGAVVALRFAPDGARLLTASADGTARLWRLGAREPPPADWDELLAYLRRSTSACLLPAQRAQHLGESADAAARAFARCEHEQGR
jgi:hypothetical protein